MSDGEQGQTPIDALVIPDDMKADLNGKGLLTAEAVLATMVMNPDIFAPYCAKFNITYAEVMEEISRHVPEEHLRQMRIAAAETPPGYGGVFGRDRAKERKIIRRREE